MTIFYPDIASFQAGIDLNKALAVSAKATEGTGYVNPSFRQFRTEAQASGAFFFAYHFLHAGDAVAQAQHAFTNVGATPLMIDCEPSGTSHPALPDVTMFTDEFRKLGGTVNLLYLPRWYWGQTPFNGESLKPFQDRGLRLVSSDYSVPYTEDANGKGWQPYGGMTPAVWQYTNNVPFNGMKIDFNAFRGSGSRDVGDTVAEFTSIVKTGKYPVAPKPPAVVHAAPYAWVSNGKVSLAHLASARKDLKGRTLTPFSVIGTSAKNDSLTGAFGAYVDAGDWSKQVPAGEHVWFPAGS